MLRKSARGALRAAALLAFAATLLLAPKLGMAASYTLNFTGTATSVGGPFAALGGAAGDSISGTLTIDPLVTAPTSSGPVTDLYDLAASSFTFHISNPGLDLTMNGSGAGQIRNDIFGGGFEHLSFTFGAPSSSVLTLSFVASGGDNAKLASLAGLPTSAGGIIDLLGTGALIATGSFRHGPALTDAVEFSISVATTPIPAALPLFISALAGLGWFARRRAAPSPEA